ncbi:MAG: hypothetical protein ACLTX3_12340 [Lachnospiraceae bacterium]
MSGYILCQVKRAKLPYYIENISTNIYSIEELCFYFYHNIYLLDSTILNEELCFWIRDQLGLKKLAENLYKHLDDDEMKVGDFILPVFKEISYLSLEEFRRLNQQIRQLANEPEVLRQKRKGDYLMEHGKYVNAIKVYQRALRREAEDDTEVTDIRKPEATEAADGPYCRSAGSNRKPCRRRSRVSGCDHHRYDGRSTGWSRGRDRPYTGEPGNRCSGDG